MMQTRSPGCTPSTTAAVVILLCLAVCALPAQDRAARGGRGPAADLSLILGRPTDRSITLSVLSRVAIEAHVEFGTHAGVYPEKTRPRLIDAGDPVELELGGLEPDTRYYYRLLTRLAGGKGYRPGPEGSVLCDEVKMEKRVIVGEASQDRVGRVQ